MTVAYLPLAQPPRPASDDGWYIGPHRSIDVYASDPAPRDTGLLDQHGVRIYLIREREPVGFRVERGNSKAPPESEINCHSRR